MVFEKVRSRNFILSAIDRGEVACSNGFVGRQKAPVSSADFPSWDGGSLSEARAIGGPPMEKSGPDRTGHPDSEVIAQAKRRRFTADCKQMVEKLGRGRVPKNREGLSVFIAAS